MREYFIIIKIIFFYTDPIDAIPNCIEVYFTLITLKRNIMLYPVAKRSSEQ